MKIVIFFVAIVLTTVLLQSCDAYSSAVNTHNRIVERHNQFAEEWNRYL